MQQAEAKLVTITLTQEQARAAKTAMRWFLFWRRSGACDGQAVAGVEEIDQMLEKEGVS